MIIGAVNSGKTVLMRMLMQFILPTIKPGSDRRAIIYDAKKNALPMLAGMNVKCPIIILNPFHADSYAWDISADVDTPAAAAEVANILVKESKGDNPFWPNSARDILGGIMKALIITQPRNWTLAEVLNIFSDLERTKDLLLPFPETRGLVSVYLQGDERTLSNIRSTIASNFASLREIANLWANTLRANPDRKISLRQWTHQESILILGNDERLRAPMEAVNEVLVSLLGNLTLSLEDSDTRRITLFLDEFQTFGFHRNILRLLTQGRSKGICGVIVLHTRPGLQAKYGDKLADAIAATCTNKAFLRMDCPDTAQWAAQVLGKAEILQYTRSYTDSRYEDKYSITEHIVEKDVVMPSQLLRLPRTNRECLYGYFTSPLLGVFGGPVHFSKLLRPLADVPNFKERPAEDQYFQSDSDDKPEKRESEINLMDIPRMTRRVLLEALKNENTDSDNES
jgi:type IV secretory pathway TraG/TraD family ATPase VirD4